METAAHTRAPWHVRGKPATGPYKNGFYVASDVVGSAIAHVRNEADARLIAAAPDMLTALRESWQLVAELEEAINAGLKLLPADVERIAQNCAASRAAIAKATGA